MDLKKIRTVFMGTPQFAARSLKEVSLYTNCLLAVTQPDRPKGRGKKLMKSPVKELSEELGIEVITPEKIKDDREAIEKIKNLKPDFIIVVAFGQILPQEILVIPQYGCINLHASLLPHLRGASPIESAVLMGDAVTGNTTMLMDIGLDTGDMLLKEQISIRGLNAGQVHDLLMESGSKLLIRTIEGMVKDEITPQKQDDSISSYAPKITREDEIIDFNEPGNKIVSRIRAMNPKPLASFSWNETTVKTGNAEFTEEKSREKPGTVLSVSKEGIKIQVSDGILTLKDIQLPGKKLISVRDFLNGNTMEPGTILGINS